MSALTGIFHWLSGQFAALLLAPGSPVSIWALACAFCIATGAALWRRKGRAVRFRALVRAMFPKRMFGRSARLDMGFTLLSMAISGSLFAWAVISEQLVARSIGEALSATTRWHGFAGAPSWLAVAVITVTLFTAYEFAYWSNHLLSHKLPFLWRFHQVHHSAETLSPLTIFRVHPVDSIVFYNMVALTIGLADGVAGFAFGRTVPPLTIAGANVLTVAAILTLKTLQHSHVWIAFTGVWGKLLLSPAHHQIHHSAAEAHHDRNLGATLAVFDWAFGTLHVPQPKREAIRFGVDDIGYDPHDFASALIAPVAEASALGLERLRPARAALTRDHPAGIFGR